MKRWGARGAFAFSWLLLAVCVLVPRSAQAVSTGAVDGIVLQVLERLGIMVGGVYTPPSGATFAGQTSFPDGTAAAPAIKVGDEQNGIHSPQPNVLGFGAGGTLEALLSTSSFSLEGNELNQWRRTVVDWASGPVTLNAVTMTGQVHTDAGSAGTVEFDLPDVTGVTTAIGIHYQLDVVSNGVTIDPFSDDRVVWSRMPGLADGESLTSTTIGSTLTLVSDSNGNWTVTAWDGEWVEEVGEGRTSVRLRPQRGYIQPSTASVCAGDGILSSTPTSTDISSAFEYSADGVALEQVSDTVLGTEVHTVGAQNVFNLSMVGTRTYHKFGLREATSGELRAFVGWTSGSATGAVSADAPAGTDMIGLQARAGDATWFVVTNDAGIMARTDTTVAVPAARTVYILEVYVVSATNVRVTLLDANGVALGTPATLTSGLPGAADAMKSVAGFKITANPAAAAHGFLQFVHGIETGS